MSEDLETARRIIADADHPIFAQMRAIGEASTSAQEACTKGLASMVPALRRACEAFEALSVVLDYSDARWPLHGEYMTEYRQWREEQGLDVVGVRSEFGPVVLGWD